MKFPQLKLYSTTCALAFFICRHVYAQTNETDTAQLNFYNKQSEKLQEINADSALYYSTEALKIANSIRFKEGILIATNNTGWIYYRKGQYQTAMKFAFSAISLAEQLHNYNELAKGYNTIGSVYNDQDITNNSVDYFYKCLAAYKKAANPIGIGRALNNIAYTYFKSKQLNSALTVSRKAYTHNSNLPDKYFFAFTLRTLSDIYRVQGNITAASDYLFEALHYSGQTQKHFLTISILNRLGTVYEQKNKIDSAAWYYKRSEILANEHGFRSLLMQPYEGLAKIFSDRKDFKNAFAYQSALIKLSDSLKNAETTQTITNLQSSYTKAKRDAEINLLKKDKDLQRSHGKNQEQFIITLIIIVLIIGAFLVFLFRRYNFEKKYSHKIVQQANELSSVNNKLTENLSFKNKMLSILSHDLRSPLGTLSAMIQLLDMNALSAEEYQIVKQKIVQQLKIVNNTLDNLLNWALTQTASTIKPNPERLNLDDLVINNLKLFQILIEEKKISIHHKQSHSSLAYADQNHVNLVIRNLLINAIKFSFEGGKIEINITSNAPKVTLTIRDYGAGIPHEKQKRIFDEDTHFTAPGTHNEKGTGLGLLLCKEFVELNNGTIGFESNPSKGSSFYFSLPKFEA